LKYPVLVIAVFMALSGCTQITAPDEGLQELKEIELRYMGRGTIAPATITDIELMEKELQALKQKGSSRGVEEMIGIRAALLGFTKSYLDAQKSMQKISIAKGGCAEQDPLKQAINKLGSTLEKMPEIKSRISSFQSSNPSLHEQSNISLKDFDDFAATLQNLRNEMQNFYDQACAS